MIVATAGHVDHGKTLLVKALTGTDTDRLPEEKKRNLTIDLGFAFLPVPSNTPIGFIDVPGHERFIKNMLCGVSGIDFALFVIAADDGPMPQTEEHLQILNLLGIENGALVITKIDRVASYRVEQVTQNFRILAKNTSLEKIPYFPVSALTGEGIEDLKGNLLNVAQTFQSKPITGNFRLPVDRSFTVTGSGLVVTGTASSGSIKEGETLRILPNDISARVRGIHSQNSGSKTGQVGQRLALNLTGPNVSKQHVRRGNWIVSSKVPNLTSKFDARMQVLTTERKKLSHWTPVHVHIGSSETTGRLAMLEEKQVEPGQNALVQIIVNQPIGALHGDRFVVRDQSARRTIGGGTVIDIYPPRRGRAKAKRLAFLREMEQRNHKDALIELLNIAHTGLQLENFVRTRNLTPSEQDRLFKVADIKIVETGDGRQGFNQTHWNKLQKLVLEALNSWHVKNPEKIGPNEDRLLALTGINVPEGVGAELARDLANKGDIIRVGTALHLPNHKPALSGKDSDMWKKVQQYLDKTGLKPPSIYEIAEKISINPVNLERLMVKAGRTGLVQRISKTRFLQPKTLVDLAEIAEITALENPENILEVRAFRDKTAIGRNMTIEVLEYFDKIKFTRRKGFGREILKSASGVFSISSRR